MKYKNQLNLVKIFAILHGVFMYNWCTSQDNDWKLIWQDEFNLDRLDTAKWTYETGAHGWGNNELQRYTNGENIRTEEGVLKILAEKSVTGEYTSARLNSLVSFQYGKLEIRAKMPDHKGNGLWPAIWMLGDNIDDVGWPLCGELDIMEYVSYDPGMVHQTIHSEANNHKIGTQISSGAQPLEDIESSFHVYGLLWTEDNLTFYVDHEENVLLSFDRPAEYNQSNWPFSQPFYFILNMAIGGDWGGKEGIEDHIFPAIMEIDYVRIWQ